jgi:endonuclease YncB( thermonuclease family)
LIERRSLLALVGSVLPPAILPLALDGCAPGLEQLAAGPIDKVAQVHNGDSLVLAGGQTVRLVGIEAPKNDQVYAAEARQALEDLVSGQQVQLFYGGARQDAYGRILAHLRLRRDRSWVQKTLLEAGAARVRTYLDNRALARPMLDAEARARKASRGLWTLLAYRVRLPEEAAVDPFGFQIVEGKVSFVQPDGDGLAMDLEHWVRAEVPRASQAPFASAGLTPSVLKGRLVRVRGMTRPGRGEAVLTLDHPEQVELLRQS